MAATLDELAIAISARNDAQGVIDGLKKELGMVGKGAKDAEKETSGLGKTLGTLGKAFAAAGVATAIAGVGKMALDAAGSVRDATADLQAQFGLTAEEAKSLGNVGVEVFKQNFGGSIAETTSAVGLLAQQFDGIGADDIQQLTQHAFRLKDAFGIELNESVDAVRTLTDKFGISAEHAFDLVTAGMQKGLNRSGDFLDTIGEYSTQFSAGGATAEQFFNVLEQGMQGGVLGTDKAADAFKEFRVRIQDGSKLTSDSLKAIGLDADDIGKKMADGSMTAAQAFDLVMNALRNTEDSTVQFQAGVGLLGTQFEDLGTQGALALTTMGGAFDDVTGKTAALDVQYSSLGEVVEGLKRKFLVEFMIPLGDGLLNIINTVMPAFNAGLAALSGWVDQYGPVIRETLGQLWDDLGVKAQETFEAVMPVLQDFAESAQQHFETAKAAVAAAWDAIQPVLEEIRSRLDAFVTMILPELSAAWDQTRANIETAVNAVQAVVEPVLSAITGFLEAHGEQIRTVLAAAWQFAQDTVDNALAAISNAIQLVLNVLQGDWSGAWENIKNIVGASWDQIKTVIQLGVDAIPAIVQMAMDAVVALMGAAWDAIKAAVQAGIDGALALLRAFPGAALAALGALGSTLTSVGRDLIQGLINGITSMLPSLDGAVAAIVDHIPGPVRKMLGIGSPSKVFFEIGEWTMLGLLGGLNSRLPALVGFMHTMAADLTDEFEDGFSDLETAAFAALHTAIKDGTEKSGQALSAALIAVISDAERSGIGVIEMRELADHLMGVFADALADPSQENLGRAIGGLDLIANAVAAQLSENVSNAFRGETARLGWTAALAEQFGKAGADGIIALGKAIDEHTPAAATAAARAVNEIVDRLRDAGMAGWDAAGAAITAAAQHAIDTGDLSEFLSLLTDLQPVLGETADRFQQIADAVRAGTAEMAAMGREGSAISAISDQVKAIASGGDLDTMLGRIRELGAATGIPAEVIDSVVRLTEASSRSGNLMGEATAKQRAAIEATIRAAQAEITALEKTTSLSLDYQEMKEAKIKSLKEFIAYQREQSQRLGDEKSGLEQVNDILKPYLQNRRDLTAADKSYLGVLDDTVQAQREQLPTMAELTALIRGQGSAADLAEGQVGDFGAAIAATFDDVTTAAEQAHGGGQYIAFEMARGILQELQGQQAALNLGLGDVLDTMIAAAKERLGIHSPSQVAGEQIGVPIAEGIAVYVLKAADTIADAASMAVWNGVMAAASAAQAAVGMALGGGGGGGADDEQVPGQPAGVTWRQLRYQQGLATGAPPGSLATTGLYGLIQAASSAGMTGMQASSWALSQLLNGPGYAGGGAAGFNTGGSGPGFANSAKPPITLNFYGPVVGGQAGMQQLAGMLNAQLGAMGG